MPDQLPDLDSYTFPERGLEAIRQSVNGGVGDAYLLTGLLFDLLDGLSAQIADLASRLDALENPPTP